MITSTRAQLPEVILPHRVHVVPSDAEHPAPAEHHLLERLLDLPIEAGRQLVPASET